MLKNRFKFKRKKTHTSVSIENKNMQHNLNTSIKNRNIIKDNVIKKDWLDGFGRNFISEKNIKVE